MMEDVVLSPVVAALVALGGMAFGLLIGRLVLPGPRKVKKLQAEIEELERQGRAYRSQVTRHFQRTGELIGEMTASYKAVYDHLADGAQSLCRGDNALPGSTFRAPRLIVDDAVDVGARDAAPKPAASGAAAATANPAAEADSSGTKANPPTAGPVATGSAAEERETPATSGERTADGRDASGATNA